MLRLSGFRAFRFAWGFQVFRCSGVWAHMQQEFRFSGFQVCISASDRFSGFQVYLQTFRISGSGLQVFRFA